MNLNLLFSNLLNFLIIGLIIIVSGILVQMYILKVLNNKKFSGRKKTLITIIIFLLLAIILSIFNIDILKIM
jgi:hypothetical protein